MKLLFRLLSITVLFSFLVLGYSNCSEVKFQGDLKSTADKLVLGDIIVGNPLTQSTKTLVSSMCQTLLKCHSSLSLEKCEAGILNARGIDFQIGLQNGAFLNLSQVLQAESTGTLKGNLPATDSCVTSLENLSCQDPMVQSAYDSQSSDPFAKVANLIPTAPGSCPAIFNQPKRNEYYVSTQGNDSNEGSFEKPWATLTHASQALVPGPEGAIVHVAPGTYTPALLSTCYPSSTARCSIQTARSGTAEAPIVFISDVQWGAKIQSNGGYTVWYNSGDHVSIVGFEIIGDAASNFGISNHGAYTKISGNRVHHIPVTQGCASGAGGAGISHGNTSDAHDNDTIGNWVHDIGPIQNNGLSASTYCTEAHAIAYRQPRGKIQNNILYRIATWGIMTWRSASNLSITNNLIFNSGAQDVNGGLNGGAILIAAEASAPAHSLSTVSHNIIRNNSGKGIVESGNTGTNNLYRNNLLHMNGQNISLQNGVTAQGTIVADPQMISFQSDGTGNYRLLSTSPAIDAGAITCAESGKSCMPETDVSGWLRPQGAAIDLGPFEFH